MRRYRIGPGRPDGRLDPRNTATRAEIAALFQRFVDLVGIEAPEPASEPAPESASVIKTKEGLLIA
jgi:hypothetical protein